jgi:hypothetical protein
VLYIFSGLLQRPLPFVIGQVNALPVLIEVIQGAPFVGL